MIGRNGSGTRPVLLTLLPGAVLLGAVLLAACQEVPSTEVLVELRYGNSTRFDRVDLTVYSLQDPDVSVTWTSSRAEPVTDPRPTILVQIPEPWWDQKLFFSALAIREGVVVGAAGQSVLATRGRRTGLLLPFEQGEPVCGNGVLEAGEACDGSHMGDRTCETELVLDGPVSCLANCRLDLRLCAKCGNSAVEGAEECDGNDFALIKNCQDAGFAQGELGCTDECTVDTSDCFGGCGDNVAQGMEECDGEDLRDATCESVTGRPFGHLSCTAACTLNTSMCSLCGNGLLEGDEECDSAAFGGLDCGDFGLGPGSLRCTNQCTIDTSSCCGDGTRGLFEECDGMDLGNHTCWTRAGLPHGELSCAPDCTLDVSGCHFCGNGAIDGPEECDGENLGGATCASLGLPGPGSVYCHADCTYDVTHCTAYCGDGILSPGEGCDDGNGSPGDGCAPDCTVEAGWSCAGSPSVCTPDTCGDNLIDPMEICDGVNLSGETCLTRGFRQGGGSGLACLATCQGYDLSGCTGGPIDSVAQLAGAVADAHTSAQHQRIAVRPGTYLAPTSIVLDECGGSCAGGRPHGVTIEPLGGGIVCFTTSGPYPVFDVVTGRNTLVNLCFEETSQAVWIGAGADAGENTLLRNRITNATTLPDTLIRVASASNAILANQITSTTSLRGSAAIYVQAEGNTIAMNLVTGSFTWAITLTGFASPTLPSRLDHNSLWIQGGLMGGGVRIGIVSRLCYRNNIVWGDGTSTGLLLNEVFFGSMTDCGGPRAEQNANQGHSLACDSAGDCDTYCNGTSTVVDMCDLTQSPGWVDADLCLTPLSNPLIDQAVVPSEGAYDHDDLGSGFFVGLAPDVGARESGTIRVFGGVESQCN